MSQPIQAIVMGASAGAVETLLALLGALPANYPLPILIVVHLPTDQPSVLAELFSARCRVNVREVEDKEPIIPGTIYFAPPNYHVLVEQNKTLSLSNEDPILFSRPAIDVLFESAADAYGEALLGILLTGANEDGARGLRAIEDAGGRVLVQDPKEAPYPFMPLAGLKQCKNAMAMPLSALTQTLQEVAYAHQE